MNILVKFHIQAAITKKCSPITCRKEIRVYVIKSRKNIYNEMCRQNDKGICKILPKSAFCDSHRVLEEGYHLSVTAIKFPLLLNSDKYPHCSLLGCTTCKLVVGYHRAIGSYWFHLHGVKRTDYMIWQTP